MRRFDSNYRMKDGSTKLAESFFNPVLQDLDVRLHAQEEVQKTWEGAIDILNKYGLKRIDDYLLPTIGRVQEIVGLGFLEASTGSLTSLSLGEKSVSVDADKRDIFTPSPFLTVTRDANIDDWAVGRLIEWVPATGLLRFEIIETHGSTGPFDDLLITMMPGTVRAATAVFTKADEITSALNAINEILAHFEGDPNSVAHIIETIDNLAAQMVGINAAVSATIDAALSAALPVTGGTLSGNLTMAGQTEVRFADADSTNKIALKAPEVVAADVTFTLPAQDGLPGEAVITDGAGNLKFGSVSSGIATAMIYQ